MFGVVDLKSLIYLTYLLICALYLLLSTSESGRSSCVRTFHPVTSDFFFYLFIVVRKHLTKVTYIGKH